MNFGMREMFEPQSTHLQFVPLGRCCREVDSRYLKSSSFYMEGTWPLLHLPFEATEGLFGQARRLRRSLAHNHPQ